MSKYHVKFENLKNKTLLSGYFVTLGEKEFKFKVYWNSYCSCAFLDIYEMSNNPIIQGLALVNNLKIRNYKLPFILNFVQINNEAYEATIDNIRDEFAIQWDDEVTA